MPDDEMNPSPEAVEESADGSPDAGAQDCADAGEDDSPEPAAATGDESAATSDSLSEPAAEPDGDGANPEDNDDDEEDGSGNEAVPDADGNEEGGASGDEDGDEEDGEENAEEGASALPVASVVEAVLFAAREPLKAAQIARAVGKRTRQETVREAIAELNVQYLETSRSFEIAEISGRYQLMSRPEYAPHIMRIYPKRDLVEKDKVQRLTPAALDTLAIIAYKQPVTRGDIEHIRGVGCGPVLRALIERGSVRVAGKRTDLVGQPLVYGTTEAFLAEFGLGALEELPLRNEFLGMLGSEDIAVEYNEPETAGKEDAEQPAPDSEEPAEPEAMAEPDASAEAEEDAASETAPENDEAPSEAEQGHAQE